MYIFIHKLDASVILINDPRHVILSRLSVSLYEVGLVVRLSAFLFIFINVDHDFVIVREKDSYNGYLFMAKPIQATLT